MSCLSSVVGEFVIYLVRKPGLFVWPSFLFQKYFWEKERYFETKIQRKA